MAYGSLAFEVAHSTEAGAPQKMSQAVSAGGRLKGFHMATWLLQIVKTSLQTANGCDQEKPNRSWPNPARVNSP